MNYPYIAMVDRPKSSFELAFTNQTFYLSEDLIIIILLYITKVHIHKILIHYYINTLHKILNTVQFFNLIKMDIRI